VDEAHRLNREVLEQIRLLTNLETTKEKLLQIILVGQPELNTLLSRPDMRQLAQRVTAHYNLQALLPARHALMSRTAAGGGRRNTAVQHVCTPLVHWLTGGVPRLINILCDRALLAAYARNKIRVGVGTCAPRPGKWKPVFVRDRAGSLERFCLWRHWWPVPAHSVSGS